MEEKQKKEDLLRIILENNYDKVDFINYCISLKENGDDLNNWDYEELKYVVNKFIDLEIGKEGRKKIEKQKEIERQKEIEKLKEEEKELFEDDDENESAKENLIKKKCSLDEHVDVDAIYFCQECKINMCNKCHKVHSGLLKNHHVITLEQNIKNVFTGLCPKPNHAMELEYFCKTHNQLCCVSCIAKVKADGKGQHKDCDIYLLTQIKNEKMKNFSENAKTLKKLYETLEDTIKKFKSINGNLNEKKDKLKQDIQNIFTKIRNELNNREDELYKKIDEKFDELFVNEKFIKKVEKFPNLVKIYLEKGNIKDIEWKDEKNLKKLIHDCINIEKTIRKLKFLNNKIKNYESSPNKEFIFAPSNNNLESDLLKLIGTFGDLEIKK